MILVAGNDPAVDALCAALDAAGRAHLRTEVLEPTLAWTEHAKAIILVEPLPRHGAAAADPASAPGLRALISAANAPGVRAAILVTPRPDDDPELRAVRRSGIPYTILRPLPLLELGPAPPRPVLVPRAAAAAPAAAVTAGMVAAAVLAALDGGACGQTNAVAPPPDATWLDVLEQAGAAPRAVAGWRARLGRWLGARTLDPRALDPRTLDPRTAGAGTATAPSSAADDRSPAAA